MWNLAASLKKNDLLPGAWLLMEDLGNYLIVRHFLTGDIKVIEK